jgi:hypothetical protein
VSAPAGCRVSSSALRRRPRSLPRPQVKRAADLFSRVRRAGPGLGVVFIDRELQRQYGQGIERAGGDGNGDGGGGFVPNVGGGAADGMRG